MVSSKSLVFWCSLLGAIVGGVAFFGFGLAEAASVSGGESTGSKSAVAADSAQATEGDAAAVEDQEGAGSGGQEGAKPEAGASSLGQIVTVTPAYALLLLVFVAIPFATAWHGGSVAAPGDSVSAAALWGLIPALLMAACGLGWAAINLWAADRWDFELLQSALLPLAIVSGVAWEVGYLVVMTRAPKSAAH